MKYVVVRSRKNLTHIINTRQITQTCRRQGLCVFARIVIYIAIASYIAWMWLRGTFASSNGSE